MFSNCCCLDQQEYTIPYKTHGVCLPQKIKNNPILTAIVVFIWKILKDSYFECIWDIGEADATSLLKYLIALLSYGLTCGRKTITHQSKDERIDSQSLCVFINFVLTKKPTRALRNCNLTESDGSIKCMIIFHFLLLCL